jgi:hypothetical protein
VIVLRLLAVQRRKKLNDFCAEKQKEEWSQKGGNEAIGCMKTGTCAGTVSLFFPIRGLSFSGRFQYYHGCHFINTPDEFVSR